jgi:ABC-type hemin transport system ATPase subunit
MTTTGVDLERSTKASQTWPVARALSVSVASGEIDGVLRANGAGTSRALASNPASHQWTPVRHLVIFPTRVM